jgi:DNA polymerase III delta prime subunit
MMLYQKHRPILWSEFVGQPKAVATVIRIIGREGFDRGAFWIEAAGANNSGVGKTTLALLIANQLADPFFVTELDGSRCDKRAVEDMERSAHLCAWSADKPYKAWIVNEAHAMSAGAVDAMLTFLESLPRNCVVIFTTTRRVDESLFGDHDSGPFASRCHCITLTNQGIAKVFAERAQSIAQAEGLDGQPIAAYVRLVQDAKNNMRAVLQRIEAGEMMTA